MVLLAMVRPIKVAIRAFRCGDDEHFLVVCRYVERNALTALQSSSRVPKTTAGAVSPTGWARLPWSRLPLGQSEGFLVGSSASVWRRQKKSRRRFRQVFDAVVLMENRIGSRKLQHVAAESTLKPRGRPRIIASIANSVPDSSVLTTLFLPDPSSQ